MKGRALLVALVLVIPASAAAPTDQYERFNRDDTVIIDRHTRLAWQRRVPQTPVRLGEVTCPTGFRLPSVLELQSIVDENLHKEFIGDRVVKKAIDVNAFPETPEGVFWTSSAYADIPSRQWLVDFSFGGSEFRPASTQFAYFRCVK